MKLGFSDQLAQLSDRHVYLLVSAVVFLALILRVLALLDLRGSIYIDFPILDESIYHTWATKIADGTYQSSSVYQFAPLPAYLMASIYKIFSPDILYIRIMNTIFGVLTCWLVYLIGREMISRTIGLFACLVACLYKPFIFYSIVPLKASLSVFLFASTIYFFLAIMNKASMIKMVLLGISIGLILNVRPQCAVMVPVVPCLILWNMRKGRSSLRVLGTFLLLYMVGLCISISPFVIRNYRVSGELALATPQSGFNLYQANKLQGQGPAPFATTLPIEQGIQFTIEASRRVGKKLSPREASSYWTHEVIKMASQQPFVFIRKIGHKTLFFFQEFQPWNHYHIGFMSDYVPFFKIPFFSFFLVLPFGMAGMAVSIFGSRKLLALTVIFFSYASTLIVYFTTVRYRLPLLIILIPFAVIGISNCFAYFKEERFCKVGIYAAIVVAFFVVESLPLPGRGDTTAYFNTHAIILNSKGFEDEAMRYWEQSSQMNGRYSAFANLALARKYLMNGEIPKAGYYLEKIPDNSFAIARKYELVGDMMRRERKIKEAISAYEKSLEINAGQRTIRQKLVRIYKKIDKKKALEEYEKLKYISSFYDIS
jgi:4-amino-4-deoxy-L-arabinose transferase-like glycosyltransferase